MHLEIMSLTMKLTCLNSLVALKEGFAPPPPPLGLSPPLCAPVSGLPSGPQMYILFPKTKSVYKFSFCLKYPSLVLP